MTNYEYFKDEIIERVSTNRHHMKSFAVVDGKPVDCMETSCGVCELNKSPLCCKDHRKAWLNAEHIEKPKLTKKERQFCELVETGWIYRNHDGSLYWHGNVPEATEIYKDTVNDFKWVPVFGCQMVLNRFTYQPDLKFSFITWDDKEPWSVEDLLKLEYERSEY